jgi:hypothetical protein
MRIADWIDVELRRSHPRREGTRTLAAEMNLFTVEMEQIVSVAEGPRGEPPPPTRMPTRATGPWSRPSTSKSSASRRASDPHEFKFVGLHPEDLADGRIVAAGDVVELDPNHPHNKRMVDEGLLLPTAGDDGVLRGEALQRRAAELDIEGRSSMTADELRQAIADKEES